MKNRDLQAQFRARFQNWQLAEGKKIFFASDFHLGSYPLAKSRERELIIIEWLDSIKHEADALFLVGDIFDFWYEYRQAVPKGYTRFLGKVAEWADSNIPIAFFGGNHDMWMWDYFAEEMGIPVFYDCEVWQINQKKIYIGHGDGLGPGDYTYKFLKKVFRNPFLQWLFRSLHPDIGIGLARFWSSHSRAANAKKEEDVFKGEAQEWLYQYSKKVEQQAHHDYYIFGHRHLPLDLNLSENSQYINLGEWFKSYSFAEMSAKTVELKYFKKS